MTFIRQIVKINNNAGMAELADAPDLGSGGVIHAGSIPVTRTTRQGPEPIRAPGFCFTQNTMPAFTAGIFFVNASQQAESGRNPRPRPGFSFCPFTRAYSRLCITRDDVSFQMPLICLLFSLPSPVMERNSPFRPGFLSAAKRSACQFSGGGIPGQTFRSGWKRHFAKRGNPSQNAVFPIEDSMAVPRKEGMAY